MNKLATLVKIDLCGSKEYFDISHGSRQDLLFKLTEQAKIFFPYANENYPKGTFYRQEGDAIYLILEKPTVALRATIEFIRMWVPNTQILPDCRIVLDYGKIEEVTYNDITDYTGEPFENISVIEKYFTAGQIGVTQNVLKNSDNTLVQFKKHEEVQITPKRFVTIYGAIYDDPRLIPDSSLVHALFIADQDGHDIRRKTFEALLLQQLYRDRNKIVRFEDVPQLLSECNCPDPGVTELNNILLQSKYLKKNNEGNIVFQEGVCEQIDFLNKSYEQSKDEALSSIIEELSDKIGVEKDVIKSNVDVSVLVEEYVCAVFLEIRFMANYFRSTQSLFDRLSKSSEFDYVIRKRFGNLYQQRKEEFIFVKRVFIEALRKLAVDKNKYIASVFHNVLLLYYLNRNSQSAYYQLAEIKGKEVFLDTNAFYAFACKSSDYFEMLNFAIRKLIIMGAKIKIFDISIQEYNDSLDSALQSFQNAQGTGYYLNALKPWIWLEYLTNHVSYKDNFEYCLSLHRYPQDRTIPSGEYDAELEKDLKRKGIELIKCIPKRDQNDLGELYNEVYEVKKIYDPVTDSFIPKGSDKNYHARVLHDANCLYYLKNEGTNPYNTKKLFVTCDFGLAKMRRRNPGTYEYLVTVPEFYEFIMPYLFLADTMTQAPVVLPNFLLAAVLSRELCQTESLEDIMINFFSKDDGVEQNYTILSKLKSNQQYQNLKEKHNKLEQTNNVEEISSFIQEAAFAAGEYIAKVKESVARSLLQEKMSEMTMELEGLKKENINIKFELEKIKKKERKKEKYKNTQRRRSAKK